MDLPSLGCSPMNQGSSALSSDKALRPNELAMERVRNLVEVAKWVPPYDLLQHFAIVSKQWNSVADSDEVWASVNEYYDYETVRPVLMSSKVHFRSQLSSSSLCIIEGNYLQVYNVRKEQWSPSVALSEELPFDLLSSIVLVASRLIVTGSGNPTTAQCAKVSVTSGVITRLPDMLSARSRHGSLYYNSTVYVFGGSPGQGDLLNLCEKLVLDSQRWEEVTPLPVNLCFTTPCRHLTTAFIFGGWGSSLCLAFDLLTEVYQTLPFQMPSHGYLTTSIVHNGRLLSFQTGCFLSWSMNYSERPNIIMFTDSINSNWCGSMNGAVYKEKFFLVNMEPRTVKVDLATVEVQSVMGSGRRKDGKHGVIETQSDDKE